MSARLALTAAALGVAVIVAVFSFRQAGIALVDATPPGAVEVAVILAGDVSIRAPRAAQAWHDGATNRIVVTTPEGNFAEARGLLPGQREQALIVLRHLGVPDSAVLLLPDTVRSTADEAQVVRRHLPELGSAIGLVTSEVHTRRARRTFRAALGPSVVLHVIPAYDPRYDVHHWWRSKRGLMAVSIEWAKTIWHWLRD